MNDILIEADGTIAHIYDDDMRDLFVGERAETRRASHVEPASAVSSWTEGWIADMRPSGGKILTQWIGDLGYNYCESLPPFLDGRPFETRAEALAAELRWLRQERGL